MKIRVKVTRKSGSPIEVMELESYLRDVVPREMPASSGIAALQAQAIAARTYAYGNILSRKSQQYDVDDTTNYQSYKAGSSDKRTDQAIADTDGQILMYGGKCIGANAVYSASNGGRIVSAKERWGTAIAYLPGKPDPYDNKAGYAKNGHGVGMSQRGAQQMAKDGMSLADILGFYYPGTTLADEYGGSASDTQPSKPADPAKTGGNSVKYAICSGDKVNVRKGPGTGNASLGQVNKGALMLAMPDAGGWCQVAAEIGGKIIVGYMSADYVKYA